MLSSSPGGPSPHPSFLAFDITDSVSSSEFDESRDDETDAPALEDEQLSEPAEPPADERIRGTQSAQGIPPPLGRIPKKSQGHSQLRSEIQFCSPLSRPRSPSPVNRYGKKIKFGTAGQNTRPPPEKRPRRRPRDRLQYGRTTRGGQCRGAPKRATRRPQVNCQRQDDDVRQGVSDAVKKLRLPASMIIDGESPRFDDSIIPRHHGACFNVFIPAPPSHVPEVFTDRDITALIRAGGKDDELINKKISAKKIDHLHRQMLSFVTSRHNQAYWVSCRRETAAAGGLQTLGAFVEEQMTWAQTVVRHGGWFDEKDIDIILDTAIFVCNAFVTRFRLLHLSCVFDKQSELALIKQVAYLVAMGNRLVEACNLLGEVKLNFRGGLLLAFVLTIPGMQSRRSISARGQELFRTLLEYYRPGDVMGLLNVIVMEHHSLCRNSECAAATRAAMGSAKFNKGLFFYPLS